MMYFNDLTRQVNSDGKLDRRYMISEMDRFEEKFISQKAITNEDFLCLVINELIYGGICEEECLMSYRKYISPHNPLHDPDVCVATAKAYDDVICKILYFAAGLGYYAEDSFIESWEKIEFDYDIINLQFPGNASFYKYMSGMDIDEGKPYKKEIEFSDYLRCQEEKREEIINEIRSDLEKGVKSKKSQIRNLMVSLIEKGIIENRNIPPYNVFNKEFKDVFKCSSTIYSDGVKDLRPDKKE